MNVFMIAGEISGDNLGAGLIRALRENNPDNFTVAGVGGDAMAAEGMENLLHLRELSVMGIWEVLGDLRRLRDIIVGICQEIEKRQPDVVVTVDFPDFNLYLGKQLKKRGTYKGKLVHYVAPTVWAWRPGRAKKVAKFLDGIICLFPFEPEYFKKHGLEAIACGHSLVEEKLNPEAGKQFRADHGIKLDTPTLGLFFGSRHKEIASMGPVMQEAAMIVQETVKDVNIIIPTLPHLEYDALKLAESFDFPAYVTADPTKKWGAMQACDAAIAVSGTVGLELAYAGTPHIIGYKMSPLTWLIVRLLVKSDYAHLANIMLKKAIVPEFLQNKCTSSAMAKAAVGLLQGDKNALLQEQAFEKIRTMLGETPSQKAAEFVMKVARK